VFVSVLIDRRRVADTKLWLYTTRLVRWHCSDPMSRDALSITATPMRCQ